MQGNQLENQSNKVHSGNLDSSEQSIISFESKLPISLQKAMNDFIELYPNWDQYRLIKAALAGFLVQNGVDSRQITRLYVGNMFRSNSLIENK